MQPPEFLKAGDILVRRQDITGLDISKIESGIVTLECTQDGISKKLEAHGFDAIDAVMAIRPSALEGRRLKWGKGAWAVHNVIAHPVMEVLARLHFYNAAMWVHDATVPRPRDFHPKFQNLPENIPK